MKELAPPECLSFLRRHRFGIMALADHGDAYAVPLFYAYDGYTLFFHSRPGAKDAFLDGTRNGCFVVVERTSDDDWTSVQVRGDVQRVTHNHDADRALKAIRENPFPPEFGIDAQGNPLRSGKGGYLWMMEPSNVTGRSSRPPVHAK